MLNNKLKYAAVVHPSEYDLKRQMENTVRLSNTQQNEAYLSAVKNRTKQAKLKNKK